MKNINCSCSIQPVKQSLPRNSFDNMLWYTTKVAFGLNDADWSLWFDYLKNGKTKSRSFNKWLKANNLIFSDGDDKK